MLLAPALGLPIITPTADAQEVDPPPDEPGLITELSAEERAAFIDYYLEVFGHGTRHLVDTPESYPYSRELQSNLTWDFVQALQGFSNETAALFDPSIAAPQLGLSPPEDPLTAYNGSAITEADVDEMYTAIFGSLIFDRPAFLDKMRDQARAMTNQTFDNNETLPIDDANQTREDPAAEIRQQLEAEPFAYWDNLDPNATVPPDFFGPARDFLEPLAPDLAPPGLVDPPFTEAEFPPPTLPEPPPGLDVDIPDLVVPPLELPDIPADASFLPAPLAPDVPVPPAFDPPGVPDLPDVAVPSAAVGGVGSPAPFHLDPSLWSALSGPAPVPALGAADLQFRPEAFRAPLVRLPTPPRAAVPGPSVPSVGAVQLPALGQLLTDAYPADLAAPPEPVRDVLGIEPPSLPSAADLAPPALEVPLPLGAEGEPWLAASDLALPQLLEVLSELLDLTALDVLELLGLVDETAGDLLQTVEGVLSDFPGLAEPLSLLRQESEELDDLLEELPDPDALVQTVLQQVGDASGDLEDLLDELGVDTGRTRWTGKVNGRPINGTWGAPTAADADGDNTTDLEITLRVGGASVDLVSLGAEPTPTLTVRRIPANALTPGEPPKDFSLNLEIRSFIPQTEVFFVYILTYDVVADEVETSLLDHGPTLRTTTVGGAGETTLLFQIQKANRTSTLFLSSQQGPVAVLETGFLLDPEVAPMSFRLLASEPSDFRVLGFASRNDSSRQVGVEVQSGGLQQLELAGRASDFVVSTIPGTELRFLRQDYPSANPRVYNYTSLRTPAAPMGLDVTLSPERTSIRAASVGGDFTTVVAEVRNDRHQRGTWVEVENAGRDTVVDLADGGVEFRSDTAVDVVRAVIAENEAAALGAPVDFGAFHVRDDRVAFTLNGTREASIRPDGDGYAIDVSSQSNQPFLLLATHGLNIPILPGDDGGAGEGPPPVDRLDVYRFSNLPFRASIEVGETSVSIGAGSPVGQVVGESLRHVDGPAAPPTQTAVLVEDLDGTVALTLEDANVNLQATGKVGHVDVMGSNALAGGEFVFQRPLDPSLPHILADKEAGVRQYSVNLSGIEAPPLLPGGIASGLGGAVGNLTIELGIEGGVCWSFGNEGSLLTFCLSNVPETITIGFNLLPFPQISYEASEVIHELTLSMLAKDTLRNQTTDAYLEVREIPTSVVLEVGPAMSNETASRDGGFKLTMSDALGGITVGARLNNLTVAAGIEHIPKEVVARWDEDSLHLDFPKGGAIGRVFLFASFPGLNATLSMREIPAVDFEWGDDALVVGPRAGRIEHAFLEVITPNVLLRVDAAGIPQFRVNFTEGGGGLSTNGRLDRLLAQMIVGPRDDEDRPLGTPDVNLTFRVTGVPRVNNASWGQDGFRLRFDPPTERIQEVLFQFRAASIDLLLLAQGVPGLTLGWDAGGAGTFATDARLDQFFLHFSNAPASPSIEATVNITDVPRIASGGWDTGRFFLDMGAERIGGLGLAFALDATDDAGDLSFLLQAGGLPGLDLDLQRQRLRTASTLGQLAMLFTLGPAAQPRLSASLEFTGVPAIDTASWGNGLTFKFVNRTRQIERIAFGFGLDAPGDASDLTLTLVAEGVPGFFFDVANQTLRTDAALDFLRVAFRLGPEVAPSAAAVLEVKGVPKVGLATWGDGFFRVGYENPALRLESIHFRFLVGGFTMLLDARGVPGMRASWGALGGTVSTDARLDQLRVLFGRDASGLSISVGFHLTEVPRIQALQWDNARVTLDLQQDRIGGFAFQFVVNDTIDANDLVLSAAAAGVPGLTLRFLDKTLSTHGPLDIVNLHFRRGPELSPQVSTTLLVVDVPKIASASWGDGLKLWFDPPTAKIKTLRFDFTFDSPADATDLELSAVARGLPGITWDPVGQSLSTNSTLERLAFDFRLGPAAEPVIDAFAEVLGAPSIASASWGDGFTFALSPENETVDSITFQFEAGEIFLFLHVRDLPGIRLAWDKLGGTLGTDEALGEAIVRFARIAAQPPPAVPGGPLPDKEPDIGVRLDVVGVPEIEAASWGNRTLGLRFEGDDPLAPPQIASVGFEFNVDAVRDADDLYLNLSAAGIPGFDLDLGAATVRTHGPLDLANLTFVAGDADQPAVFAELGIATVPPIETGSWAKGLRLRFADETARIGHLELEFLLDPVGDAQDIYLKLDADGVPGIAFDAETQVLSTDAELGRLRLELFLGRRAAPTIHALFDVSGVPIVETGSWGSGIRMLFRPRDDTIDTLTFQFEAGEIALAATATGFPGLEASWDATGGRLATHGTLGELAVVFAKRPTLPTIGATLVLRDADPIQEATWNDTAVRVDFGAGGEIGEIGLGFTANLPSVSDNLALGLNATGVPGLEVDLGRQTLRTFGGLDGLRLEFAAGDPAAPALSAVLEITGVPEIPAASWANGIDLSLSPSQASISSFLLHFLLNAPGDAGDLSLVASAQGIPGFHFDATTQLVSSDAELGELSLRFLLGNPAAPSIAANLSIEGVPRILAGSWQDGLRLRFADPAAQIDRIVFQFLARDLLGAGRDLALQVTATGVPGIQAGYGPAGGSLATDTGLGGLDLRLSMGPTLPRIAASLTLTGVPRIAEAAWGDGGYRMLLDGGRITGLAFAFGADLEGTDSDLAVDFGASGVPGFTVDLARRALATQGPLDNLRFQFQLGAPAAPKLAATLNVSGVPRIASGSFGNGLELRFDPPSDTIDAIAFQVRADLPGVADDLTLNLLAEGVPGIVLDLDNRVLATDARMDRLQISFVLGSATPPTLSAVLDIVGVPRIAAGAWGAGLQLEFLPETDRVTSIVFDFQAADLLLHLGALGVPGLRLAFEDGGGSFSTDARLDLLTIQVRKTGPSPHVTASVNVSGVPKIVGGSFDGRGLVFDLGAERIGRIQVQADIDSTTDDTLDFLASLEAENFPGFALDLADRTISTGARLDRLTLQMLVGPRSAPLASALVEVAGVPKIAAGTFANGLGLRFDPPGDRIGRILAQVRLDPPGNLTDLVLNASATNLSGIDLDTGRMRLTTANKTDQIKVQFALGKFSAPNVTALAEVTDVPQIGLGTWADGFRLRFVPREARIDRILFQFKAVDLGIEAHVEANGVPGLAIAAHDGGGVLTTDNNLTRLLLLFKARPPGTVLPDIDLSLEVLDVPPIRAGAWGAHGIGIDMGAAQIENITFQAAVKGAAPFPELHLFLGAERVPSLFLDTANKTLRTTNATGFGNGIGALRLYATVGPELAPNIAASLDVEEVPQITAGTFGKGLDLSFSPPTAQIERIDLRVQTRRLDQLTGALGPPLPDLFVRLLAEGVPGIHLDLNNTQGTTLTTDNELARLRLDFVADHAVRAGGAPVANLTAVLELVDVPTIGVGSFGRNLILNFTPYGDQIAFLNLSVTAPWLFVFVGAAGIPGLEVRFGANGTELLTHAPLNQLKAELRAKQALFSAIRAAGLPIPLKQVDLTFELLGLPRINLSRFGGGGLLLDLGTAKIQNVTLDLRVLMEQSVLAFPDLRASLSGHGIPGVAFDTLNKTLTTGNSLDRLTLQLLLGPENDPNVKAALDVQTVPKIDVGKFAKGIDLTFNPATARIESVGLLIQAHNLSTLANGLLLPAGNLPDLRVSIVAKKIPGFHVDLVGSGGAAATNPSISTDNALESLQAAFEMGNNLADPDVSLKLTIKDVPQLQATKFATGLSVDFVPVAGQLVPPRIGSILLEFKAKELGTFLSLLAEGIPGLALTFGAGGFNLTTRGNLEKIQLVLNKSTANLTPFPAVPRVNASLLIAKVPQAQVSYNDTGLVVSYAGGSGSIEQIALKVELDVASGLDDDLRASLTAKKIPGIEVLFGGTNASGAFRTTGILALLQADAELGEKGKPWLTAHLALSGVPPITLGSFGKDGVSLAGMAGNITAIELLLKFAPQNLHVNPPLSPQGFALAEVKALNVPPLTVNATGGNLTLETLDELKSITARLQLGPERDLRAGVTACKNSVLAKDTSVANLATATCSAADRATFFDIGAKLTLSGVPPLKLGFVNGNLSLALPPGRNITGLTAELFVNASSGPLNDLYLSAGILGVHSFTITQGGDRVGLQSTGGIDSIQVTVRKGPVAFAPDTPTFLGAWLRPTKTLFGLSAKLAGLKDVVLVTDGATKKQALEVNFTKNLDVHIVLDARLLVNTLAIRALLDARLDALPKSTRLEFGTEGVSMVGTTTDPRVAPWIQAILEVGTEGGYAETETPSPKWPFETTSTPKCKRKTAAADTPCGIMANTLVDTVNLTKLATKWKIYAPLPTGFTLLKGKNSGAGPTFNLQGLDPGAGLGKLDLRTLVRIKFCTSNCAIANGVVPILTSLYVSNLPNIDLRTDVDSSGYLTVTANAGAVIDKVFVGFRLDGQWYKSDPATTTPNMPWPFPLWASVEDIPSSVTIRAGKGQGDKDPPVFQYTANAGTLDLNLFIDIGAIWDALRPRPNQLTADAPGWLRFVAVLGEAIDVRAYLLASLEDMPMGGIAVTFVGSALELTTPGAGDTRLGKFFVDFQFLIGQDFTRGGNLLNLGAVGLGYQLGFSWSLGVQQLSLKLTNVDRFKVDLGLVTTVDITPGTFEFTFIASASIFAGASLYIWYDVGVASGRIDLFTIGIRHEFVMIPAWLTWDRITKNYDFQYFYIGWPCDWVDWCDRHYIARISVSYPWNFQLQFATLSISNKIGRRVFPSIVIADCAPWKLNIVDRSSPISGLICRPLLVVPPPWVTLLIVAINDFRLSFDFKTVKHKH